MIIKPTNHTPSMDKHALRSAAIAYRKSLSALQRQSCSEAIMDTLLVHLRQSHGSCTNLLTYRALPSEVDTEPLLHLPDYHMFAPVTHDHSHMTWRLITPQTRWSKGVFGILEPKSGSAWPANTPTILLCPLTAFDRSGNRLGMGKGCFDYWLSSHQQHIDCIIGLAFSGQEVAHIPAEGHDVPMNYVITEKEVIACLN